MKKEDRNKKAQDQMAYLAKRAKLRLKIRRAAQKLEITAPRVWAGWRTRDQTEIIEPLSEQEFEEQMKIRFFSED